MLNNQESLSESFELAAVLPEDAKIRSLIDDIEAIDEKLSSFYSALSESYSFLYHLADKQGLKVLDDTLNDLLSVLRVLHSLSLVFCDFISPFSSFEHDRAR
ncbi:hypothetical protein [Xylella fastidiosa]|uniref:hypothetical protein n=1 Tax=Xylella fastidiosa TaxID=2371 RepID=UPI00249F7E8A|nr:hypothetical protein [Xylella fastidiosa]WGZ33717.1 hypothetical protein O4445_08595 [Xylella fastidiosa subsp. pauca]WGZ36040.1 hypothetical protein O4443_08570 [Xylella fastidiosa subsp. pauca]